MAFWWVNQGNNHKKEASAGYLWAPNPSKGGRPHWKNMAKLQVGDIVFCYENKKLSSYCQIEAPVIPFSSPYPTKYSTAEPGYLALAVYTNIVVPLSYLDVINGDPAAGVAGISLATAKPILQQATKPALGYLFELDQPTGMQIWVRAVGGAVPTQPAAPPVIPGSPTTSIRATVARLGQGPYGREVRSDFAGACGLTRVKLDGLFLQAAHLKPWKTSSDADRLNAANGVLLHASAHHALDEGLISFDDTGKLLIKPVFLADAQKIGLVPQMQLYPPAMTPQRRIFLADHRAQHGFPP